MDANTVLALGLGVTPPWRLVGQRLDTSKQPHELHLEVAADRGSLFPCPVCGKPCKAHDFAEFTWRHLNFFSTTATSRPRCRAPTAPSMACCGSPCPGPVKAAAL